jgi:hypothetical protein
LKAAAAVSNTVTASARTRRDRKGLDIRIMNEE